MLVLNTTTLTESSTESNLLVKLDDGNLLNTLQDPEVTMIRPTVLIPVVFILSEFAYCAIGGIALITAIIVACFADAMLSIMISSLLVSMVDELPRPLPPIAVIAKSNDNRKQRMARLLEPRLRSLITSLESVASRELQERQSKSPSVKESPLMTNIVSPADSRSFNGSPVFDRSTSSRRLGSQRPILTRSLSFRIAASISARPGTTAGSIISVQNINDEKCFDLDSDVNIGAVSLVL